MLRLLSPFLLLLASSCGQGILISHAQTGATHSAVSTVKGLVYDLPVGVAKLGANTVKSVVTGKDETGISNAVKGVYNFVKQANADAAYDRAHPEEAHAKRIALKRAQAYEKACDAKTHGLKKAEEAGYYTMEILTLCAGDEIIKGATQGLKTLAKGAKNAYKATKISKAEQIGAKIMQATELEKDVGIANKIANKVKGGAEAMKPNIPNKAKAPKKAPPSVRTPKNSTAKGPNTKKPNISNKGAETAKNMERGAEMMNMASKSKLYRDRTFKAFQKQLLEYGEQSLRKSQTAIQRRLSEHLNKLDEIKKCGGYASSVQREIRTFEFQLQAIEELLKSTRS